ncbi:MAG: hypothetical protein ACTSX1_14380, partial [Candidatus Heimdallarchaeaceae archaeon]
MSYNPKWSLFNQIFGGDSKVEVIDDGTAASVVTNLDNTQIAEFTGEGLALETGVIVSEFSDDNELGGLGTTPGSDQKVSTQKAVKSYVGLIHNSMQEPTGFSNRSDNEIGTDTTGGTDWFYVEPTGSEFTFWLSGKRYVKTERQEVAISDVEGLHFFYFDKDTGILTETTSFTTDLILFHAFAGVAYWDADAKEITYLGDERHSTVMDGRTHLNIHVARGTLYFSGLALGDIVADGTGSTNVEAQLSVTGGVIYDEDISFTHASDAAPANLPIWYRSGAALAWRKLAATDYIVTPAGTGRAAWNKDTAGTWSLTEATDGYFVLSHIFATNDNDMPYIIIPSQDEYATLEDARVGATTEINDIVTSGLPFAEFLAMGTVILQTDDTFANAVKSSVRTTDEGDDYVDWRFSALSPAVGSASDHGALSGLGDDDHLQYARVDGGRNFTGHETFEAGLMISGGEFDLPTGVAVNEISNDSTSSDADQLLTAEAIQDAIF